MPGKTDSPDFSAMENCICFNLRKMSRLVSQFYSARLRDHGLLPTQTPILYALSKAPTPADTTMTQLSTWLGMDRTTLVRNLRPLERDGLVRGTGKGRGNRIGLGLTPKGRTFLKKFAPDWLTAQREALAALGEENWARLFAELERAAQGLGMNQANPK